MLEDRPIGLSPLSTVCWVLGEIIEKRYRQEDVEGDNCRFSARCFMTKEFRLKTGDCVLCVDTRQCWVVYEDQGWLEVPRNVEMTS